MAPHLRSSVTRTSLAIAGVGILSLVAVGCGGTGTITMSGAGGSPTASSGSSNDIEGAVLTAATVRQAAESAVEATSGRFEIRIGGAGAASGESSATISGEFNGDVAHTKVVGTDAPSKGSAGSASENADVETVVSKQAIFLRGGLLGMMTGDSGSSGSESSGSGSTSTDTWYRVPLDGLGGTDIVKELTRQVSAADIVSVLDGAYGDVTKVGTADVRGTSTTQYRVQIDPAKVAAALDSSSGLGSALGDISSNDVPDVEIWVDADNVIRRLTIAPTTTKGADGGTPTVTCELWDLNSKIDIATPTDAKDFDLGDVLSGVLGK